MKKEYRYIIMNALADAMAYQEQRREEAEAKGHEVIAQHSNILVDEYLTILDMLQRRVIE